jgi:hypothetical protein
MTDHHNHDDANHDTARDGTYRADIRAPSSGVAHRHGGHGLMMIACCIPMLVIAVVLVATGVVSVGFLFLAVACTAMMALMMRGMHGGPDKPALQEHPGSPADPRYR